MLKEFHEARVAFDTMQPGPALRHVQTLALELLDAVNLNDLNRICAVICKLAACLHAPRLPHRQTGTAGTSEDAKHRLPHKAQSLVRKFISKGLALLDLQDAGTQSLLHPALSRILYLVSCFEKFHLHIHRAQHGHAWLRLKSLIREWGHLPLEGNGKENVPEERKHRRVKGTPVKEHCETNARMKCFSTVVKRPALPRTLRCTNCSHEVSSCWYFVNPKNKLERVLIPWNGHAACRTKKRKRFATLP